MRKCINLFLVIVTKLSDEESSVKTNGTKTLYE